MKEPKKASDVEYDLYDDVDGGFRRLRQKNSARHLRQRLYYAGLLLLLLLIFLIGVVAIFFRVSSIKVKGESPYTDEEIVEASGIEKGMNIYLIKKDDAQENILEAFPYVSSVEIDRNLPTGVDINIDAQTADYFVEIGGEMFIISKELRVLERMASREEVNEKYPECIMVKMDDVKTAVVGSELEFVTRSYFDSAKKFLGILWDNDIRSNVSSVDFTDRFNIFVVYESRLKANLGDGSEGDLKLRFMHEIVKDLGEAGGTIDIKNVETGYVLLENGAVYD